MGRRRRRRRREEEEGKANEEEEEEEKEQEEEEEEEEEKEEEEEEEKKEEEEGEEEGEKGWKEMWLRSKPSSLLSFLCWLASNFVAVTESSLGLCVKRPTVEEKIQQ